MENQRIIEETKKYFALAIKSGLLKFEIEQSKYDNTGNDRGWLSVYYLENQDFEPSVTHNYNWRILCAQAVKDYYFLDGTPDTLGLVNRITTMLAENLRSARQDVNGLMKKTV